MQLKNDAIHNRKDILNAIFYLKQTKQFETITFIFTPYKMFQATNHACYDLEINLQKQFLFSNIYIKGLLRDKEQYKSAYLIDIGDTFDQTKHQHSLESIEKIMHLQGYFQAQIKDTIIHNPEKATTTVTLNIKRGKIFYIDNIQCHTASELQELQQYTKQINQQIVTLCQTTLAKTKYDQKLIKRTEQKIQTLLEQQGFMLHRIEIQPKIHHDIQSIDLIISVTLNNKKEFVFIGNSFLSHQQLLDHLLLYGKLVWKFPSTIIIDEIKQFYKTKGFWNVHISLKEEQNKIFCIIDQGARAQIAHIIIQDNDTLSSPAFIKQTCAPILKNKYFDQDIVKKTFATILKTYKQIGYWDAKIVKEDFIPTDQKYLYDFVLHIDPGAQRIIGNIYIENHEHIQNQLRNLFTKNVTTFDQNILVEQKQWITKYLKTIGYQKISVTYKLIENETNSKQARKKIIDIVWNIDLQESPMKFGKTIIIGNNRIPYKYLMKEICYQPTESWDKNKLELTIKNIKNLNIFESIQLYPSQDLDEDGYKPMFLRLIHADRYELKTRFGLQQIGKNLQFKRGFTYKLGGSLIMKNICNIADQAAIETDITRFYRNITASFEYPWFLNKKIRTQFKGYNTLYEQPVYIGSKNSLYKATQTGFLWNIQHNKTTLTLSNSIGINFLGINEADQVQLSSIIDYDQNLIGTKQTYLSIEPNIVWQNTDNPLNPHQGHLSFISCKAMIDINNKTNFLKTLAEHTAYFSLNNNVVIALRARAGHIFNQYFNQINPIERFYLGGASSLRGYERDYCPPFGTLTEPIFDQHAGLPSQANDLWRYAPQGGRTMFNINAETRFNVYKNLGLVLFIDSGALFKDSMQQQTDSFTDHVFTGSGFGLRYDTQIGPLRFDCAYKWNKQYPNFESSWVWYLTLGHAF